MERIASRRAIGMLAAVANVGGNKVSHAAPQQCLFAEVGQLDRHRDAPREFDERVVEVREATLDGIGHQHAVALRAQEIARHEHSHLQVLAAGDRAPAGEARRQRGDEPLLGGARGERTAGIGIQEARSRVVPAGPVRVQGVSGVPEVAAVERPQHLERRRLLVPVQPRQQGQPRLRCRGTAPECTQLRFAVDIVTDENLIGAFPRQDDAAVARMDGPTERHQRRRGSARQRRLRVPGHVAEAAGNLGPSRDHAQMVDAQMLHHQRLPLTLVEALAVEAEAVGAQLLAAEAVGHGGHDRGIEAAREV